MGIRFHEPNREPAEISAYRTRHLPTPSYPLANLAIVVVRTGAQFSTRSLNEPTGLMLIAYDQHRASALSAIKIMGLLSKERSIMFFCFRLREMRQ